MMQALLRAARFIPAFAEYMPPDMFHRSIAGILKQGVERLDNVRQTAGEAFLTLARLSYEEIGLEDWERWCVHGRDSLEELLDLLVRFHLLRLCVRTNLLRD